MDGVIVSVKRSRDMGGKMGMIEISLTASTPCTVESSGVAFAVLMQQADESLNDYLESRGVTDPIMRPDPIPGQTERVEALKIVVGMDKGKKKYNVTTHQYQEFGVPFYPEHMKQCGIDPRQIPDEGHVCKEGTFAIIEYVNGRPKRVLRLERG